jgi:hypothetical protein
MTLMRWLGFVVLAACASPDSASEATSSTASAIINGSDDTTHGAVVTVIANAAGNTIDICTGTIVQIDATTGTGWVATAAHCVLDGPPIIVWEGANWGDKTTRVRHNVVSYASDQRFDLDRPQDGYDFAVIRIDGVTASTPFIPLAGAPDAVAVGAAVDNLGFGRTTKPPASAEGNTKRRLVSTRIAETTATLLSYDAATEGACQGDSGGPWLVGDGANRRVVGIDSYGNSTCDGFAVAGRVQSGLDFFHAQLGLAVPEACALCTNIAHSSGGRCANDTAESCICKACAKECACIGSELPDAGVVTEPTAPPADAGPTIVIVHTPGKGGCATSEGSGSAFGALALAFALSRLRPYRSSRR